MTTPVVSSQPAEGAVAVGCNVFQVAVKSGDGQSDA